MKVFKAKLLIQLKFIFNIISNSSISPISGTQTGTTTLCQSGHRNNDDD